MFDTIDRHLAREWLKSFGLTTGAILGLFHVQNLYDNLGDFLEHGAGAAEIFRYHFSNSIFAVTRSSVECFSHFTL